MDKANYVKDLLGLTDNDVAQIMDVPAGDLKMHVMGLEKLTMEKRLLFDLLYSYTKLAASNGNDVYARDSQPAKHKSILEQLRQNEEQQRILVQKISDAESLCNQQLTRWSLLEYLAVDQKLINEPWSKALKAALGKKSKPVFDKELYSNQIKLKTLRQERRHLEQELEVSIRNSRSA
jgi:hypothetical protein